MDTTQTTTQSTQSDSSSSITDQLKYPLSYNDQQILREALGGSQALPIGAIYITTTTANPLAELGYGAWTQIAIGQTLVGYKSGDANFGTLGASVGEASHILTNNELPILGSFAKNNSPSGSGNFAGGNVYDSVGIGGGGAHNNVQPSLVVNIWKRTG